MPLVPALSNLTIPTMLHIPYLHRVTVIQCLNYYIEGSSRIVDALAITSHLDILLPQIG